MNYDIKYSWMMMTPYDANWSVSQRVTRLVILQAVRKDHKSCFAAKILSPKPVFDKILPNVSLL